MFDDQYKVGGEKIQYQRDSDDSSPIIVLRKVVFGFKEQRSHARSNCVIFFSVLLGCRLAPPPPPCLLLGLSAALPVAHTLLPESGVMCAQRFMQQDSEVPGSRKQ